MVKTVNIRLLKDKLSGYLREVQRGDVVLVTDRGRVVAELRQPTYHAGALDAVEQREERLVADGVLRRGLPNTPAAYSPPAVHLPVDVIDRALAESRGGD